MAIVRGAHVAVRGNMFFECRQEAIHIGDRCAHILIDGNVIDQNYLASPVGDAIWAVWCDGLMITNNVVRRSARHGIHVQYNAVNAILKRPKSVNVANNVVSHSANHGFRMNTGQEHLAMDYDIVGNTSGFNGQDGFNLSGRGAGVHMDNNSARFNTGAGLAVEDTMLTWQLGRFHSHNNMGGQFDTSTLASSNDPPLRASHLSNFFEEAITVVSGLTAGTHTTVFSFGLYAKGLLTIQAGVSDGNFRIEIYEVEWDGTSLVSNTLKEGIGTGTGATDVRWQMRGSDVQVRGLASTTQTMHIFAEFHGGAWLR